MPNRYAAVAISAFWIVMMALLVERDVLPHWQINQRLDLRSVSQAVHEPETTRWAVLNGEQRIGAVETEWLPKPDGWLEYRNRLELREFAFLSPLVSSFLSGGLRWQSSFHVAPDGNLQRFQVDVFLNESQSSSGESTPFLTVQGKLVDDMMKVHFRSGTYSQADQFFYEPHSLLTTSMGPIDRLPNLSVGQKWQYRVMNPLSHKTELVRCEVTGEKVITWRGDPVPTYVVEQQHSQTRGRCWVARDGAVLRQELPLGSTSLVLVKE